jgi:hypothetical protein
MDQKVPFARGRVQQTNFNDYDSQDSHAWLFAVDLP